MPLILKLVTSRFGQFIVVPEPSLYKLVVSSFLDDLATGHNYYESILS